MCQTTTFGFAGRSPSADPDPNVQEQEHTFGKSVTNKTQVTGTYVWELNDMNDFWTAIREARDFPNGLRTMSSDSFLVSIGTWIGKCVLEASARQGSDGLPRLYIKLRLLDQRDSQSLDASYLTLHVASEYRFPYMSMSSGFINAENPVLDIVFAWPEADVMTFKIRFTFSIWAGKSSFKETKVLDERLDELAENKELENLSKPSDELTANTELETQSESSDESAKNGEENEKVKQVSNVIQPEGDLILSKSADTLESNNETSSFITPTGENGKDELAQNVEVNEMTSDGSKDNNTEAKVASSESTKTTEDNDGSGSAEGGKDEKISNDDNLASNMTSSEMFCSGGVALPFSLSETLFEFEIIGNTLETPNVPQTRTGPRLTVVCSNFEFLELTHEQEAFLKEKPSLLAHSIEECQNNVLVIKDFSTTMLQEILDLANADSVNVILEDLTLLRTLKKYKMDSLICIYMALFIDSLTKFNCQQALLNSWHLRDTETASETDVLKYEFAPKLHGLALQFCQDNWKELMQIKWFPEFVIAHSTVFGFHETKILGGTTTWKGCCKCSNLDECIYLSVHQEDGTWSNPKIISLNPQVFFDITVDVLPLGRITMELRGDVVPKTAENFRALCTGENGFGYKGSCFDFVYPKSNCQGGDINGGKSIYGESFTKEDFSLSHEPGTISMVNGSRFLITSTNNDGNTNSKSLNGRYVVFGKVVAGMDVLAQIESYGYHGKTTKKIVIEDCGQL